MRGPSLPEVFLNGDYTEYLVIMPDGKRYGVDFGNFLSMLERSRELEPLSGK